MFCDLYSSFILSREIFGSLNYLGDGGYYGGLFTSQCSSITPSPPRPEPTPLDLALVGAIAPSNASVIPPSPCTGYRWSKGVHASFLSSLISGCVVVLVPGHMLLLLVFTTSGLWWCRYGGVAASFSLTGLCFFFGAVYAAIPGAARVRDPFPFPVFSRVPTACAGISFRWRRCCQV